MTSLVEKVNLNTARPSGASTVFSKKIKQRNLVTNPRFWRADDGWDVATDAKPGDVVGAGGDIPVVNWAPFTVPAAPDGADACGLKQFIGTDLGGAASDPIYSDGWSSTAPKFVPGDTYSVRGDFLVYGPSINLVFRVVWADSGEATNVYSGSAPTSYASKSAVVTVPTVAGYEEGFEYLTLEWYVENSA